MPLIVKIFIDEKQIGKFSLINTGHRNSEGEHLYRFREPEELNHHEIYHNQKKPWAFLLEKAMKILKAFLDALRRP